MYIVQKVINNINLLKATSTLTTLVVSLNPLKFYIALSMTILENYILFKKKKRSFLCHLEFTTRLDFILSAHL